MSETPDRAKPETRAPGAARDVRSEALDILLEVDAGMRFVDEILAARVASVAARDRPLLRELTYGCLRHQVTLDHLLDAYLRAAFERQRPEVAAALRLGAYQLVYLSRVPPHAAVYQTLEALKGRGLDARTIGFANAVLKRLSADVREKTAQPSSAADDLAALPIRDGTCHFRRPVLPAAGDLATHLAVKLSHPRWLVARWLERFGDEETRRLCAANNDTPPLTARVTSLAPSREALIEALESEGFEVEPGRLAESLYLGGGGGDLAASRPLRSGWMQIQDETAMRIGAVLAPPAVARVLDLCAAPGGKALQLLERVREGGHLVVLDRSEEKLERLRENLSRVSGAFTARLAPAAPDDLELGEVFSHILVDAPCSNTGVLARRPEARLRIRREDLKHLSDLQHRLLEAAYRHLRPGGRLLYATCSIEPEENENAVARFCAAHADLTELETRLFLPHRSGADGGFYSLLFRAR